MEYLAPLLVQAKQPLDVVIENHWHYSPLMRTFSGEQGPEFAVSQPCQSSLDTSRFSPDGSSTSTEASSSSSSTPGLIKDVGKQGEAELRRMFESVDVDGDGKVCKDELGSFFKKLNSGLSETEIDCMMKSADENGDGMLELEEFMNLYRTLDEKKVETEAGRRQEEEEEEQGLRDAFSVFDRNSDGFISADELLQVVESLNLCKGKKPTDYHHMIRAVDQDGDGQVNFEEFKLMMSTAFT